MDTILKKGLTRKIFQSEKDLKGNKTEDVTCRSQVINFSNRRGKKAKEKVVHSSSNQLKYVIWTPGSLTCGNLSGKRKKKRKERSLFYFASVSPFVK